MFTFPPAAALARAAAAVLLAFGALAAQAGVATSHTLQTGVQLPGFPHKVDVYRPAGATRAIVFLHGHGGRSWQVAYDLGLNLRYAPVVSRTVDWNRLAKLGVIAIFPQGMPTPGTTLPTWSNYVTDSGQDDVAFLSALSTHARQQWGATTVAVGGHSAGGAMTARLWCEATPRFDGFFSVAGPMTSPAYPHYGPTCTPLAPRPYSVVIGDKDTKLSAFALGNYQPSPAEVAAGLTDSILVSEWRRNADRAESLCGEELTLEGRQALQVGNLWRACGGRIQYTVLRGAEHALPSIQQRAGVRLFDWVASAAAAVGSVAPR